MKRTLTLGHVVVLGAGVRGISPGFLARSMVVGVDAGKVDLTRDDEVVVTIGEGCFFHAHAELLADFQAHMIRERKPYATGNGKSNTPQTV